MIILKLFFLFSHPSSRVVKCSTHRLSRIDFKANHMNPIETNATGIAIASLPIERPKNADIPDSTGMRSSRQITRNPWIAASMKYILMIQMIRSVFFDVSSYDIFSTVWGKVSRLRSYFQNGQIISLVSGRKSSRIMERL